MSVPTIGELYKTKTVTEERLVAAVDAYMADQTIGAYRVADGITVDLAAAVQAHKPAVAALENPSAGEPHRRTTVRDAIVLAGVST